MFRTDTRHALRALTALAAGNGPMPISTLSRQILTPAPMLAKVLHRLALLGFVHGRTGRGGGYRLARPARELRLAELVEAFEGPAFARSCLFGLPDCSAAHPCPLHGVWDPIRGRLLEVLESATVADLHRGLSAHGPPAPRGSDR